MISEYSIGRLNYNNEGEYLVLVNHRLKTKIYKYLSAFIILPLL